ncbi:MAG: tRNA pseudouridine(38-40) synthase TruA [Candidatus Fermentibacteraceae bacterium]|nr:tRNA pseudouridine(38-40) synthase TruA [Candidatus Fermentibacteraceae bacterium]
MDFIRIMMKIEYDGTEFHGWQLQPGARSVQGEIESVLESLCGRKIRITGSGRTDSGVHALGQIAHADIKPGEFDRVENGLPSMLAEDVAVTSLSRVEDSFHARFDAVSRLYRYRISKEKHPLTSRYSYILPGARTLDIESMLKAASLSIGESNWIAMAKEGSSNSNWIVRVIDANVLEDQSGWTFLIQGNRFLRGLVRIWAGTLVQIGSGSDSPELITELLESGDRNRAGASLPAKGLTLLEVRYS